MTYQGRVLPTAPNAGPNAVEIQALSHWYARSQAPPVQALDGLNLNVRVGEFVAVVGPSGCGKSTLLNSIAGLIRPSSGTVMVEGGRVSEAVSRRRLGLVFQDPALFSWRDTEANIRLPMELARTGGKNDVQSLVELVMLRGFEHSYPKELSGGMRSRVAIARALALSPAILLMDEPFGSLDEMTAHALNQELLKVWEKRRPSIVLVTHSISQAVFMADKIVVLSPRPGRIVREILIDIPRPRTTAALTAQRFVELSAEVRRALNDQGDDQTNV